MAYETAFDKTPMKCMKVDEVQKSEWKIFFNPNGVSIRPSMSLAYEDGLRSRDVVVDPTRIPALIYILETALDYYGLGDEYFEE